MPTTGMNLNFWFEEDPEVARYAVTRTGVFTRAE